MENRCPSEISTLGGIRPSPPLSLRVERLALTKLDGTPRSSRPHSVPLTIYKCPPATALIHDVIHNYFRSGVCRLFRHKTCNQEFTTFSIDPRLTSVGFQVFGVWLLVLVPMYFQA